MEFIQRKIYQEIKDHLSKPEISLILGPRQAGKTTVMEKLADELSQSGKKTAYFNLDIIEQYQYFKTQHLLLDQIKRMIGSSTATIFIDEIQRLENAGLFLKGLYDLKTDYKFIVSGSGSLELKADIIEPMTGRKKDFLCLPLSFTEFAAHRVKTSLNQVVPTLAANPYHQERLMNEYFAYGGYPRVILSQTHEEKVSILSEIFSSYLEKDIQLLLKIEKNLAFRSLVKILADQVGNIVNRAELASTLGINEKTILKYLDLLEKTFIIILVKPFFRNARKELTKSPKVYFLDLGFLRLAQGLLSDTRQQMRGGTFENACLLRLNELNFLEKPHFWHSAAGAEVDFIINSPKTGEIIPIEVKLSPSKNHVLGKSMISFIKTYQSKYIYFYTLKRDEKIEKWAASIRYLPYYKLPQL